MPSRLLCRALCAILVLTVPSIASADIVHLKNGGKIEGRVEVRGDQYVVTTDRGFEVSVPLQDVRSVEVRKTSRDAYVEKRAKVREGDVAALLDLAKWCESKGLKGEARSAYEEVLGVEEDHEAARKALGFVRIGDEWMTEEEAKPHLGLVRHQGRWVTPEKKAELKADEERKQEEKRIRKLVRRIGSRAPDATEEARARLMAYEDDQKFPVLLDALGYAEKPVRIYAAQELGRIGKEDAVLPLAEMAMEDRFKTVRISAVRALKAINAPNTAVPFMEKLSSRNPYHRLHAVEALSVFPDKRSVYWLIKSWRGISGGFGQGYVMSTTMQNYIQDYQLASGGSGFVAIEVADPEIGTLTTGVVFETKVQYAEIVARTQTLVYLTGDDAGYSREGWANWWNENKDTFELAARDPHEKAPPAKPEKEG